MFISNVSHELKNPISIVLSQVDVLLNQKDRTVDEYRATLTSLRDDVQDIAYITENLLQMAKIKSEGFHLDIQNFQLDEAILECQSKLLRSHPEYSVSFQIEGQPDSQEKLTVEGNEALLKLAFINIMDNCCKYSDDKHVDIRINSTDRGLELSFRDKGAGIAKEDMEMIFQPFYRNINTKHVKGYGIGLSLIDAVLQVHKLKLKIESTPKVGSLFAIPFTR
jgi:K+-sensing histidine kinase KdpD